jgi:CDP-diacylglycerol--glycerol-3-phosphate 3-phosphatidyltransferase
MESRSVVNLPNAISLGRLVLAPAMIVIAWHQQASLFRAVFTAAVVSDLLDGVLARILNQRTEFGAKLDSWADMATYLALFFGTCILWPRFIDAHLGLLMGGFGVYTVAFSFGFLKYGRLTSYHTLGGKLTAVLMACSMILWFFGGPEWPFGTALVVAMASGIEQIAITLVLPAWRPNVPSLWHAMAIR